MNLLRVESLPASVQGEGGREEDAGKSTLEKYEARIRKDVSRDIRALLSSTKAYTRHYSPSPTSNVRHLKGLAEPKEERMHPQTSLARRFEDPVMWAKLRAYQLEEEREAREAAAAQEAKLNAKKQEQLRTYQEQKHQISVQRLREKNDAAKEEAAYAAQVAKYINAKAAADLQKHREKQARDKSRAEELRQSISVRTHGSGAIK